MQIEIRDLNHKVEKLEKRMLDTLKSEIREWAVAQGELADRVDELDGYYKMCLKYLIDDDKQFNTE